MVVFNSSDNSLLQNKIPNLILNSKVMENKYHYDLLEVL